MKDIIFTENDELNNNMNNIRSEGDIIDISYNEISNKYDIKEGSLKLSLAQIDIYGE